MRIGINLTNSQHGGGVYIQRLLAEWSRSGILNGDELIGIMTQRTGQPRTAVVPSSFRARMLGLSTGGSSGRAVAEQIALPLNAKMYKMDVLFCRAFHRRGAVLQTARAARQTHLDRIDFSRRPIRSGIGRGPSGAAAAVQDAGCGFHSTMGDKSAYRS